MNDLDMSSWNAPKRKRFRMNRYTALVVIVVLLVVIGCGVAMGGRPDWWKAQERTSDTIARAGVKAVPFPMAVVKNGGFLERKNLAERLKRFSDPNHIGYVYVMSFGKFIGYYTIKGKISSTNSQMTNTTQTWNMAGDTGEIAVDSVGDDGSFGPNEDGKFFFTTQGTMVQTTADVLYSDQPLAVDVPSLTK